MPENIFRADKVNDILVELCNDVADHGGVDLARYRDRLGEAVTAVTAERLPKWDDLEQAMLAVAERVWDQTYEGDEDGGAGDLQAVVAALVTEFGFPLGAGLDTIHRPDSDEPRYTGWQWIRRCIVDGDKWPCATAGGKRY